MKFVEELLDNHVIDLTEALHKFIEPDEELGMLLKTSQMQSGLKNVNVFLKNPKIASDSLKLALDNYRMYVKSNRFTAQLYAKTKQERDLYGAIVNDLLKSNKYKLVRKVYQSGGTMWTLRWKQ